MKEMDLFGASNKEEEEVVTDPHDLEMVKKLSRDTWILCLAICIPLIQMSHHL